MFLVSSHLVWGSRELYGTALRSLCCSSPGLRAKTRLPWVPVLQTPHLSSENPTAAPVQLGRLPGWAVGLGRVIWGRMVVWDRMGSFAIPPSLSKVFPHLPRLPRRVHIHVLLHTHRGTAHRHTRGSWACLLRLTSCPPSLGTKMPSLREEPLLVTRTGQRWGQIWGSRRGGIREELQGWQPKRSRGGTEESETRPDWE